MEKIGGEIVTNNCAITTDFLANISGSAQFSYDQAGQLNSDDLTVYKFADFKLLPPSIAPFKDTAYKVLQSQRPAMVEIESLSMYHAILCPNGKESAPWLLILIPNHDRLTRVMSELPIGIILLNRKLQVQFMNASACNIFGETQDEVNSNHWHSYFVENVALNITNFFSTALSPNAHLSLEATLVTALGSQKCVEMNVISCRAVDGTQNNYLMTVNDVTEEKRLKQEIETLAKTDLLTGLLNRAAFLNQLKQLDEKTLSNGLFIFIDVNKFKEINDNFGHSAGDHILQLVAKQISNAIRSCDLISRFGGDEFALFLPAIHDPEMVKTIAQKLTTKLSGSSYYNGANLPVDVSIGLAWPPATEHHELNLNTNSSARKEAFIKHFLHAADSAMYFCKTHPLECHSKIFDDDLRDSYKTKELRNHELIELIEKNQFNCLLQPIVDVNRHICSFEVLSRANKLNYHSDIEDLISTALFKPEIKLRFFNLLTENAFRTYQQLCLTEPLPMSINIDVSQLQSSQFCELFEQLCKQYQVPATQIKIEVTEKLLEADNAVVDNSLNTLVGLGCTISMDDFGTGYSSFERLLRYEFSELKIERYFIANRTHAEKFSKSIRAMAAIGLSLGLNVVAEGIETEEDFAFCKKLGINQFQGYLVSRPVSITEFNNLLKKQNSEQ
jgi:diguanylate cyclase (GGDEF)-like protein/PAS domain S-box-containing protein